MVVAVLALQQSVAAHVTIKASGPLAPSGFATVTLTCPSERASDTTKIVLEVPDDFLQNGGRLSRLQFPPDWKVKIDKQDVAGGKPSIKRLTLEDGKVPPDGFIEIRLSLQLPETAGRYRFPATQTYADGTVVAWTQLVEGAEHPAPEIVVGEPATPWKAYIWPIATCLALVLAVMALILKK